jgi:glutamyl-tRNA synthetase/glutamyl-Q tRNA(Asp) synthetase
MIPLGPPDPGPIRPDRAQLPARPTTRFAPAPTGFLHLGHLVNAVYAWGIAGATGGRVILRIEDHDRQRSRRTFETALLDDLERLGLAPDEPSLTDLRAGPSPFRQSDDPAPYLAAVATLRAQGRVYACTCARPALLAWRGPGCPGRCRERALPEDAAGSALRAWLGEGDEPFDDLLLGVQVGDLAAGGDLTVRDRHGNWSYPLCVVVDDLRHGVDLVIRGRDLLDATPGQLRLGRLLGRESPPAFLHHPLLRKPSGAKLSKADHDTAIRDLLERGSMPDELLGFVAAAVGLLPEAHAVPPADIADLFATQVPPARYAPADHGEMARSNLATRH